MFCPHGLTTTSSWLMKQYIFIGCLFGWGLFHIYLNGKTVALLSLVLLVLFWQTIVLYPSLEDIIFHSKIVWPTRFNCYQLCSQYPEHDVRLFLTCISLGNNKIAWELWNIEVLVFLREVAQVSSWCCKRWERNVVSSVDWFLYLSFVACFTS